MPEQRSYQAEGSAFLRRAGKAILADEPGLGKTNQALMAVDGRTLIVCPATLQHHWRRSCEEWRPDVEFEVISYSRLSRREGSKTFPAPRAEFKEYDTVVFDEAHYLKGRTANWTQAAIKLPATNVFMLTGTPLSGWAWTIWPLLRIIHGPKDRRFSSYWRWVDEWFRTWKPPYRTGIEILGLHEHLTWADFAAGCDLGEHWLRRETDLVLDELPPLSQQTIEVDLRGAQRTAYNQMKDSLVAEIGDGLVVSWSSGDQFVKLAQMATSLGAVDKTHRPHGAKMDALGDIMEEQNRPMVCFTHFRDSAACVAELARQKGKQVAVIDGSLSAGAKADIIDRFQAFELDVLVGTFSTISEGVTLTAADLAVFVERSPRALFNYQAQRRIRRFGQELATRRIDLVARGTVDEKLLATLNTKGEQEAGVISALDLV
jgi:SNF2 family DNA or RNA helicase